MSSATTTVKPSITTKDAEMTGIPSLDAEREKERERDERKEKEETPRLSPVPEDKTPRVKPERQYSRDVLIQLMTTPLSTTKHPCLESSQNKSLVSSRGGMRWLEDRWDHRRHTDSLTDEDRSDGSLDPQKKRMNDPKAERLRKDQDVVLSPQRRSFNSGCSGCFVNLPPANQRRPDSPPTLKPDREPSHRELAPARRIGSGRIMRDPVWDYRDKDEAGPGPNNNHNHDFNFRQRDDRFERRSYERSHDKERGPQRNSRHNNNDRRKEPDEPEWFSSGPTSQHDTIELHGFDGPVEEKVSAPKKQNKNNRNNNKNRKNSDSTNKSDISNGKKILSRKSSPEVPNQTRNSSSLVAEKQPTEKKKKPMSESTGRPKEAEPEGKEPNCTFDIEDILNFDALPPLLNMSNGCQNEVGSGSGSRFSQFFRKESPSPPQQQQQPRLESSHSSAHDEMFNSMINDITNTNISIPPDGDTYFAPISPAAPSKVAEENRTSSSLLQMLQGGGQRTGRKITKKPSLRDLEACGKIHSVEELEARLRGEQGGKPEPPTHRPPPNKEEELAMFRKLMMSKQVQNMQEGKSSSHPVMPGGFSQQQQLPPPQKQQQHQQSQQQHGMNHQQQHQQQSQQQQQQLPIPHDLVMKLLHVQQQQRQQEMLNKLLVPPAGGHSHSQFSVPPPMPPPLSPDLAGQVNKELLQRPEAQQLLRSLKRGDVTVRQLVDQLRHNPNAQPLQCEMVASVIKVHTLQSGGQREPSPAEQLLHQMLQAQPHQQLRVPSPHANAFGPPPLVSPNLPQSSSNTLTIQHPHPAFGPPPLVSPNLPQSSSNTLTIQHPHPALQRVPSPRELVVHTQTILQNALLKKKLEEQKENFRKRQELQRGHSPNMLAAGGGSMSPNHNTTSPTPLAFTPTSVLRKMTADKDEHPHPPKLDGSGMANGPHYAEMMRPKPFRQLPTNTWNLLKPIQGRAIVKGNNNISVPPLPPPDLQFMQQLKGIGPRGKMGGVGGNMMLGVNRNAMQQPPPQPPTGPGRNMVGPNNMMTQHGLTQSVQQLLMNHNYNAAQHRNNPVMKPGVSIFSGLSENVSVSPDCTPMVRGGGGGGMMGLGPHGYTVARPPQPTSPVSNQLARWFSPELLAQARAGQLPDMPPVSPTQNMLSVEELERLQQAVHN